VCIYDSGQPYVYDHKFGAFMPTGNTWFWPPLQIGVFDSEEGPAGLGWLRPCSVLAGVGIH